MLITIKLIKQQIFLLIVDNFLEYVSYSNLYYGYSQKSV